MNCNNTPKCSEPCGDCTQEWPVPAGAQSPAEAHDKWDGAEEWMPLAWELCANECGEEACAELIWEGGPIPEPWGDRWLKYEDQAKEMIAMVRKHVRAQANVQPKGTATDLAVFGSGPFHVETRTNAHAEICNTQGRAVAQFSWSVDATARANALCALLNSATRSPAPAPEVPAGMVLVPRAVLQRCRDTAMTWTMKARVPECGEFGGIAQDLDALLGDLPAPSPAVGADKLWLWKNFVDGRPEYWAFDNPFPVHMDGGDPQTLGEPCGYALFKPSRVGRTDVPEAEVIRRIKAAKPAGDEVLEALRKLDKAAMDVVWAQNQHDARVAVHWLSEAAKQSHAVIAKADADSHVPVQGSQP